MKMNGNTGMALLLIACGALLLLGKFGLGLGWFMSYLLPIGLLLLGYYGVKNGRSFFGWLFMIIGGVLLLSKLSWLIGIVIAVGLIVFGINMLKRHSNA